MGRRKQIALNPGRRRPLIQLESRPRGSATAAILPSDRDGNARSITATKVTGIGLLGVYDQDSDSDENNSNNTVDEKEGDSTIQKPDPLTGGQVVHDELAGFLAEINEIGSATAGCTPGENLVTEGSVVGTDEEALAAGPAPVDESGGFDPAIHGSLLPAPWSACFDEGSGFYYYWNVETNEVQWHPPACAFEVIAKDADSNSIAEPLLEESSIEAAANSEECADCDDGVVVVSELEEGSAAPNESSDGGAQVPPDSYVPSQSVDMFESGLTGDCDHNPSALAPILQYDSVSPEAADEHSVPPPEAASETAPSIGGDGCSTALKCMVADSSDNTDAVFEDISDGESCGVEMEDYADQLLEDTLSVSAPTHLSTAGKAVEEATLGHTGKDTTDNVAAKSDEDEPSTCGLGQISLDTLAVPMKKHTVCDAACQTENDPQPKDDDDLRAEIMETAGVLTNKLQFFGISKDAFSALQILLIELESRLRDWKEGALGSRYLAQKLKDIMDQMLTHEKTAAPPGWSCHWHSHYNAYFYNNLDTGESSWEYPSTEPSSIPSQHAKAEARTTPVNENASTPLAVPPPLPPPSEDTHIPPQPPLPDEPLPPLPSEPEPECVVGIPLPPLPPETATGVIDTNAIPCDVSTGSTSDPYRMAIERKLQSGDMPPGMEEDFDMSSDVPLHETCSDVDRMTTSHRTEDTVVIIASSPVLHDPVQPTPHSAVRPPASSADTTNADSTAMAVIASDVKPKKTKRAMKVQAGIPSKKLKKVTSLVHKWQSLKQQEAEQQQVDNDEEDDDIANNDCDSPTVINRRIEEWKKQQVEKGSVAYNPNFQQVSGDWRERVRKAKLQRSTDDDS